MLHLVFILALTVSIYQQAQIVHADIKSKNVLLSVGRQTAKIAVRGDSHCMLHVMVCDASIY